MLKKIFKLFSVKPTRQSSDVLVARALFFLHIPKCAGTSLLNGLSQHVPPGRIYKNTSIFENLRYGREEFYNLTTTAIGELLVLWGHHLHEQMLFKLGSGNPILLATVVREPIDRFVSHISYDFHTFKSRGAVYDVNSAIENVNNPMCSFLIDRFPSFTGNDSGIAERAFNILKEFDYVFDLSELSKAEAIFGEFFGVAITSEKVNVGKEKSEILSKLDIKLLKSRIHEDLRLYEMIKAWPERSQKKNLADITQHSIYRFSQITENNETLRSFLTEKVWEEYREWGVYEIARNQKIELIQSIQDELSRFNLLDAELATSKQ